MIILSLQERKLAVVMDDAESYAIFVFGLLRSFEIA